MGDQPAAVHPDRTAWQVQTLRLTAFPSPSASVSEPDWWHELLGEPPEKRVSRPKRGGQQEEGSFGGGRLILRLDAARIDWLLTTTADQDEANEGIQTIGALDDLLGRFRELMLRWLAKGPPLQRLAFGAVLLQVVENRQKGFQLLARYLPALQLEAEGSSDFLYRINRPRGSCTGIQGLSINRLATWYVATWKTTAVSLGPDAVQVLPGLERFTCNLELDINTGPEFQAELSGEQLTSVFQEVVEFGLEIARQGDVK